MLLKALSVKQPWANLIVNGSKTIETRKWYTPYRGDLLIVTSKNPPIHPAGCAVAIVRLVDCRPMAQQDERFALCDLYVGAYSWLLTDVRPIDPVPVTGALGLFDVDLDAARQQPVQTQLPL
jgi:ASCH domain